MVFLINFSYFSATCASKNIPMMPESADKERSDAHALWASERASKIPLKSLRFQWRAIALLGIEIRVFSVRLDKVAARLYLVAHKHRKQSVCLQCIFNGNAL